MFSLFASRKKAQTTPTISIGIVLIAFLLIGAIGAIVSNLFFNSVNDAFQLEEGFNNETKEQLAEYSVTMPLWIDNAFLLAVGLFFILGLVGAYYADNNPYFLIIDLLLLAVVFFLAMIFSNAYDSMVTSDAYTSFQADYPKTDWILDNLLIVGIIILGSVFAVVYFKNRLLT